jgi:hypothetical protein
LVLNSWISYLSVASDDYGYDEMNVAIGATILLSTYVDYTHDE